MNNNTAIAFLALFGFVAVAAVGVAIVVASRGMGNQLAQPGGQPVYGLPVYSEAITPAPVTGRIVFENEERTKITWNSDGLPVEIVTTRHVEQLP